MGWRSVWNAAAVAALGLAALSACDQRLAAQPAREHEAFAALEQVSASGVDPLAPPASRSGEGAARRTEASAPARKIDGRPMWSDNRRYSAEENARYQFDRHAAELGARDFDDFLVKAHAFVNAPPEGTLSLTRANGDKLLFDPKSQLFGVVRSDGAPRTVFKPETGKAYWDEQVAEESGAAGRSRTARTAEREDRS